MKRQNEALTKVNAELDRFVYSASHDLRSPLSSLLGLIHVAREDDQWDKQEYLNLMEKSVKRLDTFISDIIDFSRNARLEVVPEKIDFDSLIAEILEDLQYVDNFEKIEKRVEVKTLQSFYADKKRLRIILTNLIANAIKHHIPESREKPFVDILIKQDGNEVKITISDNGPGIKAIYLKDIFKMFFRATNRSAGSGLGLYIVQETVNKLAGEVSVQSQEGEGTHFVVKIPSAKSTV
jgi:signal transduction histidine kinase